MRTPSPALVVAVAAAFWGLWWLPLRGVETAGLDPVSLNLWLYVFGALALLPVLWSRRGRVLSGGAPLWIAAAVFAVAIVFWNLALLTGLVVRVTLLFYLAPIWGTLLGFWILSEAVGPRRLVAVPVGLGGAGVLLSDAWPPLPVDAGDWMGLASGLLFAVSATAARYGRVDGRALTGLAFLLSAVGCLVAGVVLNGTIAVPAPVDLLPVAAAAILWLVPVTWMLLWGAAMLDPGRLSLLMLLEVVAAAVSAALLADEPFGLREALGCGLILAAGMLEATGKTDSEREAT